MRLHITALAILMSCMSVAAEPSNKVDKVVIRNVLDHIDTYGVQKMTDKCRKVVTSRLWQIEMDPPQKTTNLTEKDDPLFQCVGGRWSLLEFFIAQNGVERQESVFVNAEEEILYLRIANFDRGVGREFARKVAKRYPRYIILDLRDNKGGGFDEANRVIEQYADAKDLPIATQMSRPDGLKVSYTRIRGAWAAFEHMVILVNATSCSVAELVTLRLKTWKPERVTIVGSETCGKDVFQFTESFGGRYYVRVPGGFWFVGSDMDRKSVIGGVSVDVVENNDHVAVAKRILLEKRAKERPATTAAVGN